MNCTTSEIILAEFAKKLRTTPASPGIFWGSMVSATNWQSNNTEKRAPWKLCRIKAELFYKNFIFPPSIFKFF
jgi:hypothetical protein